MLIRFNAAAGEHIFFSGDVIPASTIAKMEFGKGLKFIASNANFNI